MDPVPRGWYTATTTMYLVILNVPEVVFVAAVQLDALALGATAIVGLARRPIRVAARVPGPAVHPGLTDDRAQRNVCGRLTANARV